MSAVKDRPQMNYYRIRFTRLKPDESEIRFVVAIGGVHHQDGPKVFRPIFANKFPGWVFTYMPITEAEFDRLSYEAHEANLIDFDHRHPDELFDAIKNVNGNFFDPWRFT